MSSNILRGVDSYTRIRPLTVMVPLALILMSSSEGLMGMGGITSVSRTPRGTVFIMRSSRRLQVEKKKSCDSAICLMSLPPSTPLKMRASYRFSGLLPTTRGFLVALATNSVALRNMSASNTSSIGWGTNILLS